MVYLFFALLINSKFVSQASFSFHKRAAMLIFVNDKACCAHKTSAKQNAEIADFL